MFTAKNHDILNSLFDQAKALCGNLNNYVSIIVRFMNKKSTGHHLLLTGLKVPLEYVDHLTPRQIMQV